MAHVGCCFSFDVHHHHVLTSVKFFQNYLTKWKQYYTGMLLCWMLKKFDFGANPKFNMATNAKNAIWLAEVLKSEI